MAAGWRWRWATLWAAVAVVVGLALAIGAGAFSSGTSKPVSLYQRTLEVAGQYRCPVCASESAAVSDASEAVQIRSLIEGWLKKGDTQAQIRSFLVSDYGTSILEKPPATGLNTLVWALPAVAGALGVAGLGFAFARWRRVGTVGTVGLATAGTGPAGQAVRVAGQGPGVAGVPPSFGFGFRRRGRGVPGAPFRRGRRRTASGFGTKPGSVSCSPSVPAGSSSSRCRPDSGGWSPMAGGPVIEPKVAGRHRHGWSYRSRRGTATGRHARSERPGSGTGRVRRGFGQ